MTGPAAGRSEIQRLLGVAARQAADADVAGLSTDGRFEHAYAAALAIATAVIRAEGQRIHGPDHHRLTFEALAQVASPRGQKGRREHDARLRDLPNGRPRDHDDAHASPTSWR